MKQFCHVEYFCEKIGHRAFVQNFEQVTFSHDNVIIFFFKLLSNQFLIDVYPHKKNISCPITFGFLHHNRIIELINIICKKQKYHFCKSYL